MDLNFEKGGRYGIPGSWNHTCNLREWEMCDKSENSEQFGVSKSYGLSVFPKVPVLEMRSWCLHVVGIWKIL